MRDFADLVLLGRWLEGSLDSLQSASNQGFPPRGEPIWVGRHATSGLWRISHRAHMSSTRAKDC